MARADRLERMDVRRTELELEYRAALIDALKIRASGKWGLFGHQDGRSSRAAIAPTLGHLSELAEEIDDLRETLALTPFTLHQEFLAARGKVSSHAVGEPKQAQAWLDRLATDPD